MIIVAVVTGVFTGILSGLLGIGGGAILVASAVFFLGISQHVAQAAAIAAVIPIALVGVLKHHRNRLINYRLGLYLAIGVTLGGICGAFVANSISEALLRKIFSVFFAIMSVQMFWSSFKQDKTAKTPAPPDRPTAEQQ
jgi:uncharacterized membrane protein YfcA